MIVSCLRQKQPVASQYPMVPPGIREGAVFIGRGTVYGNPYKIGDGVTRENALFLFRKHIEKMAVDFPDLLQARLDELRGKTLACWCRECDACHGDVWLEFANRIPVKKLTKNGLETIGYKIP